MKIGKLFFATLFTILVILGVGCNPCKNTECLNGGTCVDGTCNCAPGYGGSDCSGNFRDSFVGDYSAVNSCNNTVFGTFTTDITEDATDGSKVIFSNFAAWTSSAGATSMVYGLVTDGEKIQIPSQTISSTITSDATFEGTVTFLNAGELLASYTIFDGVYTQTCSDTLTVQ
ncbi:MAG: hypothetical protein H6581_16260 [Bacteroidia bacterium]|nr:hypothetical protein [Bacteroidia bacterium]